MTRERTKKLLIALLFMSLASGCEDGTFEGKMGDLQSIASAHNYDVAAVAISPEQLDLSVGLASQPANMDVSDQEADENNDEAEVEIASPALDMVKKMNIDVEETFYPVEAVPLDWPTEDNLWGIYPYTSGEDIENRNPGNVFVWNNIFVEEGIYTFGTLGVFNDAAFDGDITVKGTAGFGTSTLASSPLGDLHVAGDYGGPMGELVVTPYGSGANRNAQLTLCEDEDCGYGMYVKYHGESTTPGNTFQIGGFSGSSSYGPHLYINRGNPTTVGIGTRPIPGYTLAVNGKLKTREVFVTLTGWPDYVFAEDYKLMDLEHVEQYVRENQHLPGVPPADVMESGGVPLGDTQKLLFEKVEELTLYAIQQKNEIGALKAELEQLRAQMSNGAN